MCGRYSVYVDDDPGIREIIEQVQKLHPEVKTGEIFPADLAPVLIAGNNGGHLATERGVRRALPTKQYGL